MQNGEPGKAFEAFRASRGYTCICLRGGVPATVGLLRQIGDQKQAGKDDHRNGFFGHGSRMLCDRYFAVLRIGIPEREKEGALKYTGKAKDALPLVSVTAICLIIASVVSHNGEQILSTGAFPSLAMATVPGAVFSVWHNISGALLAGIFRRMKGTVEEGK